LVENAEDMGTKLQVENHSDEKISGYDRTEATTITNEVRLHFSFPLYWKPVIYTFLTKLKIRTKKTFSADMINFFNEESYNVMDFLLAISSRKRKKLQHRNEIL